MTTCGRAGDPGRLGDLQQLLLLDDPHRSARPTSTTATRTEFRTPDGRAVQPGLRAAGAQAFGIEAARVEEPDDLPAALAKAFAANAPYLLDVRTRGDVPMPRTGHWDIAEFLASGND